MQLRLISKLTIAASAVLLLAMAMFAYLNIDTLKTLLLNEAISDADKLSETIIRTTYHQMLKNDRAQVYQMIQEVGSQQGIERIRLINKNGSIIFSTNKNEIGTSIDKKGEACNMCHAGRQPLLSTSSMSRSRLFYSKGGKQVLGMAKAIYNEESCSAASCHFHPKDFKVLGVLDIIVSLDAMHTQLDSYRDKIIILTIILLGLITLCLTLLTQKLVNRPVRQLLVHTKKLARGELDGSVRFSSNDELGELADAFNTMTLSLKKARLELEDWARNLEVKVEERTSEIKLIQAQLIRSEKLASLGELVAGIAHEINNPLTGILVFASIILKDTRLDSVFQNDMETIIRETQRCAKIVRGLLEFARGSVPQKSWTSLNGITQTAMTLIEHQSLFQNISIKQDFCPDMPKVFADPNQIEQVFINILLNAGQAMTNGGCLTLKTGITDDGYYAFVSITDTGCGINEDHLGRIFDPFFTTKENKGTGLGLSVSYGIIEKHGGMIDVQSRSGSGTTFTIELPLMTDRGLDEEKAPDNQPANYEAI